VDGWFRPPSRLDTELAPEKRYYSYEVARRDPAGFARWWKLFGERFETMGRELYIKDPAHKVRFRLKPNGRSKLFQSEIRVNSRGFRGPEFTSPKADVYRIVCLGESTTFGCTLTANDRPWPEVLQEKIGSRLKLSRPVEVVNAGIPSFTLANTLDRLEPDILPLKPDILISYHGYNGFSMLHDSFPSTSVSAPPGYIARPLRLLALAEYRARLLWFKRELTAELKREPPSVSDVLDTPYAHDYGRLIHFARTNGIRLVLATHALAVNKDSDRDVIEFYRAGFPAVHWLIKANRLHSALVEHLSALHPGVGSVDAGRGLDGQHEKFIDLVHLTQEGRETLAETMFQAIRQELESTLRPDAANSTMAGGAERSQ
jgi:lysophospholipase L1-like esterase